MANDANSEPAKESFKEKRIKEITIIYYSIPEIRKAIFDFSQNRECIPRYYEGFGKRPDSFQYKGDIFELVKKGATSFHCSEELWSNPLSISTDLSEKQLDELRIGWDLLLDIDSKYLDYSKILALQIIKVFKFHGIKNFGIKFSGSKGFHLIIPWKAFPKEVNNLKTSNRFPEWPRIVLNYITEKTKPLLIKEITKLYNAGKFNLTVEDEDCHTKIENYLTEHHGEIGKKIHTARSRNDQVLVTMRLFMKDKMVELKKHALKLADDLIDTAKKYEFV